MRHIVAAAIYIRSGVHDNDWAAIGSSRQSIELHSRLSVFDNETALVLHHLHKTVDGSIPEPPSSSEFLGSLLGICGSLHLLGSREGWRLLWVKGPLEPRLILHDLFHVCLDLLLFRLRQLRLLAECQPQ